MGRASLRGRVFTYIIKRQNIRQIFVDPNQTAAIIETCRQTNAEAYTMPAVKFKSQMERTTIAGMDTVVLTHPRPSGKVLWYLHGGAYIFHASNFHWQFLDRIVQHTRATVIATNYPLAPNHQAAEVIPALRAVYQALVADTPARQIVVAGDSAGGGLALACAQDWRDQQLPQPAHVCLLSPWLDIAMHNPDARPLDADDVLLSIPGLVMAGASWRGSLTEQHPWVSPLYGDLSGLAPLAMWVGTHEIFYPDVRLLRDKAQAAGVLAHYTEAPGMFHAYQIFPVPEAKRVEQYLHGVLTQALV